MVPYLYVYAYDDILKEHSLSFLSQKMYTFSAGLGIGTDCAALWPPSFISHLYLPNRHESNERFKKKSTVYSAQGEYNSARSEYVYSPEENLPAKVKETIKKNIALEQESKLLAHTQTLVKQGHLLSIAALEKSDAIWKSYMFDIKKEQWNFY